MARPARLVPVLAVVVAIGLSACGGGDGDSAAAPGEFADGACVDRTSTSGGGSGIQGAAAASNPKVVDCDSPEAAGVLEEAGNIDECPEGTGIGVFSVGDEGDGKVEGGAFCIVPQ